MSYRGQGGWYRGGDYGYGSRRGDLWDDITGFVGGLDLTPGDILKGAGTFVGGLFGGGQTTTPPPAASPGGSIMPALPKLPSSVRKPVRGALQAGVRGLRSHRRMNVANVRALRRALRRAKGFEHLARGVLHFTSPKKHVGAFKMHHRKRR